MEFVQSHQIFLCDWICVYIYAFSEKSAIFYGQQYVVMIPCVAICLVRTLIEDSMMKCRVNGLRCKANNAAWSAKHSALRPIRTWQMFSNFRVG